MPLLSRSETVVPKQTLQRAPAWRNDPEIALMLRVADGDETAFAELSDLYLGSSR